MSRLPRRLTAALAATAAVAASALLASPAEAGGYTSISQVHYGFVQACKTPVSSPYGPLWKVSVRISNHYSGHGHQGGVSVYRRQAGTDPLIHRWHRTVGAGGTSDTGTVYLSRLLPDYLSAGIGELNGQGGGGTVDLGTVSSC